MLQGDRAAWSAGLWLWVCGVLLGVATFVGAEPVSKAALEADNPVKPLPQIPLGINRTFAELPEPPTPQRVRLGRWLYYDQRVSLDGSISCATCHRPENAFSEPTPFSTGIAGKTGNRKAPTFINLAWTLAPHFFWDGRAASLEEQAIGPMVNPVEMGNADHAVVVERISNIPGYRPYFKEAFGDEKVDLDRIAKAIADYERTRISGNSPWDRWRANPDPGDDLTPIQVVQDDPYGEAAAPIDYSKKYKDGKHVSAKVKWGDALFFGKAACNQCHLNFNFTDQQFHNLGVGWDEKTRKFADVGRVAISKKEADTGAFKTPGLRDLTTRAPYMHDGSHQTLREVVELYNRGGIKNPHLSPKIQPLNLTEQEVDALVEFLKALDGEGYMDTAPKHFPQ